jgi:hypothetical protein
MPVVRGGPGRRGAWTTDRSPRPTVHCGVVPGSRSRRGGDRPLPGCTTRSRRMVKQHIKNRLIAPAGLYTVDRRTEGQVRSRNVGRIQILIPVLVRLGQLPRRVRSEQPDRRGRHDSHAVAEQPGRAVAAQTAARASPGTVAVGVSSVARSRFAGGRPMRWREVVGRWAGRGARRRADRRVPLRCLIGGRADPGFLLKGQIAWASSVNAAATRRADGAWSPSS